MGDSLVLGKHPDYIRLADELGARRFSIPDAVWDLPIAGRPTVLMWAKRRWSCCDADCEVNTFSETTPEIGPRAVLTQRARRRLADMVNVDGDSIAAAAASFGVGWHTANVAVTAFTDCHIDDPSRLEGVEAIGVDEKRFLNATCTHHTAGSAAR